MPIEMPTLTPAWSVGANRAAIPSFFRAVKAFVFIAARFDDERPRFFSRSPSN